MHATDAGMSPGGSHDKFANNESAHRIFDTPPGNDAQHIADTFNTVQKLPLSRHD